MRAQKKFKLKKLKKAQRIKLASIALPVLAGLFGLIIGITCTQLLSGRQAPNNLVWAADSSVSIPRDLRKFLENKDDCREYRGTGTPTGVGLWGVYQTSKGQFAKIAYGCSWSLNTYIVAVKQKDGWQLIPPTEYFAPFKDAIDASRGALPYCAVAEKYKIPKDIESFCITADGSARPNTL